MTGFYVRSRSCTTKYFDARLGPFETVKVCVKVFSQFSTKMSEMVALKKLISLELLVVKDGHFLNSLHDFHC